jgi:hypothetical protein
MDWLRSENYRFTAELDAAGWAWQFLRRCDGYRSDYLWFMQTWRQLETDYGAHPARDYFRWKQDPRAWRADSELTGCSAQACPGEHDQVLIECWMGVKWGFRKFPIDPMLDFPPELAWRDQAVEVETVTTWDTQTPERVALGFDLSLPLDVQLDAARRKLALLRHGQVQAGTLPPLSIRQGTPLWTRWLRLLDGLDAGLDAEVTGAELGLSDPLRAASMAREMSAHGYRRLLLLPD